MNPQSNGPVPILLMAQKLAQGGSERQLTEIVKALDRSRFEPHVAVLRTGGFRLDELRAAGVPTVCIPLTSFTSPSTLRAGWQLNRYLRRHRIRLAHSFDVPANSFLVPVARVSGVPAILSSQRAYRTLTPAKYLPLMRFSDRLVDGIVVNCRAIERHLADDEKVSGSLIRLCYNGIDATNFRRRSPHELPSAASKLAGSTMVAGVVCALRAEKDLPTLIRGFALARAIHPNIHLVIVGSGAMQEPLEQLSRSLGQTEHCLFVPTTTQVPEWLSALDVFVLPSTSEALSNSLMEAMVCGCAPVATNVGGNPELVAPGERGLLFKAGDSEELGRHLTTLAADKNLRMRFAESSRRFIEQNFTLERSVARMSEIYTEALGRR